MHIDARAEPVRARPRHRDAHRRKAQQRARAIGPVGAADMHLIAVERHAVGDGRASHLLQHFLGAEHGFHIEQPEPLDRAGRPFEPERIGDAAAHHLIAAAYAEDAAAAPQMRREIDVPARLAESAARSAIVALEPGRMTSLASAGRGSPGETSTRRTPRLGAQRIEIVEIGDIGQQRNGDGEPVVLARRRAGAKPEGVLGGQARGRRENRARGRASRQPVRSAMKRMPASKRHGSPRNLLTMKPRISAASSASSTALQPTSCAMTPPRSISPTSTTGASTRAQNPYWRCHWRAD